MQKRNAYITGKHIYAFRRGEKAKVIGVFVIHPEKLGERVCYQLEYADGFKDFIPVSEVENGNYAFTF